MPPADKERGVVAVVLVACVALMLISVVVRAQALLIKGTDRGYRLLDNEQASPLYCTSDLEIWRQAVPQPWPALPGGATTPSPACFPPRLDHAAQGSAYGRRPAALCALVRHAQLPAALFKGLPCG